MTAVVFYDVAPKEYPARIVHLCLSCAVRGVDDDMVCTEREWAIEVDEDLHCELCGKLIASAKEE